MGTHLAEISRRVGPGAHAVLLLDRAGWHASPRPRVPGDIGLIPLPPPHAPELASMEDAREQKTSGNTCAGTGSATDRVRDGYDAVVEACCDAWNELMRMPEQIASITERSWAQAKI